MIKTECFSLIHAISEIHDTLKAFSRALSTRKIVESVTHHLDLEHLPDAYRVQEFVDAELHDGNALSWCIEVTGTPTHLVVESDVRIIRSEGSEILFELEEKTFDTVDACVMWLRSAVQSLTAFWPFEK